MALSGGMRMLARSGAGGQFRGVLSAGQRGWSRGIGAERILFSERTAFQRTGMYHQAGFRGLFTTERREQEAEKAETPSKTEEILLDLTGATLDDVPTITRPIAPHITHAKAEFHYMVSISSRIGAIWLCAALMLPNVRMMNVAIEYLPVGHLAALGIFSVFSMGAHLLFIFAQHNYLSKTRWGDKADSFH